MRNLNSFSLFLHPDRHNESAQEILKWIVWKVCSNLSENWSWVRMFIFIMIFLHHLDNSLVLIYDILTNFDTNLKSWTSWMIISSDSNYSERLFHSPVNWNIDPSEHFRVEVCKYWFLEFFSETVRFMKKIFKTNTAHHAIIYNNTPNSFFITSTIFKKYQLQNFPTQYFS